MRTDRVPSAPLIIVFLCATLLLCATSAHAQTPSVFTVQPSILYTHTLSTLTISGSGFSSQNTVTICSVALASTCSTCTSTNSLPIGTQQFTATQIVASGISTGGSTLTLRVCLAVPGSASVQAGSTISLVYNDPQVTRLVPTVLRGGVSASSQTLDFYGSGFDALDSVNLRYDSCSSTVNSYGIVTSSFVKINDTQVHFDSVRITSGSGSLYLCLRYHRTPGTGITYVVSYSGLSVNNPDQHVISVGMWIGIAFGILAGIGLIAALVAFLLWRISRSRRNRLTYGNLSGAPYTVTDAVAPPSAPPVAYSYQQPVYQPSPPSAPPPPNVYQQGAPPPYMFQQTAASAQPPPYAPSAPPGGTPKNSPTYQSPR